MIHQGTIRCILTTWGKDGYREVELPYRIYIEAGHHEVKYEKKDPGDQLVFKLEGGPVGTESFYINRATLQMLYSTGWTACEGNNMHDRCFIEGQELEQHTGWYMGTTS